MNKGYKTSEFWLSLAAILLGALLSSGVVIEGTLWAQMLGVVASVLGALGYTVSRSYVKAVEAKVSALRPLKK